MDAIILAAGRGSRLGMLTSKLPKPLTQLAGKPLLEWQLMALEQAGVESTYIVTGYNAEALTPYGDQRLYNPNWASSNMVRSLLRADSVLSQREALVCYGDIVYRADIVGDLINSSANVAITFDIDWHALWSERFDNPLADAESFVHQNGRLKSIGKRVNDARQIQGQYMGLLKFTPQGWFQVKTYLDTLSSADIDKLDMTTLLSQLLDNGVDISTVAISGGWVEVDNPADIELYERKISTAGWHHDWS